MMETTTTAEAIRVLLIEENTDDALLLLHALRPLGAVSTQRVDDMTSLDRALRAGMWHVAVCDNNLPGAETTATLRRLREHDADLPVVVVSGNHGEAGAVAMMKAGARDYLVKDSLERLPEVIKRVIEEAAGRRRQRAAERELDQSRQLLQLAVEGAQIVIWHWFLAENSVSFAPGLHEALGTQHLPDTASFSDALALVHRDDREAVEAEMRRCVAGEIAELETVYRIVAESGEVRWVEARGKLFRDARGAPARLSGTLIDITKRRRLEEQLMHSKRGETIGRLAGGIAHDFNNLLTVVLSYCQLLESRSLDDGAASDVSCIRTAAERAAALTGQLLVYSQRQVTRSVPLDMREACDAARLRVDSLLSNGVRCAWDLQEAGVVLTDPSHVEQVVTHLVTNADDAMPAGGQIKVSLRSRAGRDVPFACEPDDAWVELCVADEGVGMPTHVSASAFDPFFTTKVDGKGTGLGLSTCRTVVEQAGGHVAIESELGAGTRVYAWWPSQPQADMPVEGLPAEPEPACAAEIARVAKAGRVLLVEDDPLVRGMASMALRDLGHGLTAFEDAEEALSVLKADGTAPQLVITDVVLPGMSGPQLVASLRARWPSVQVIFTSGYASETVLELGLDATDVDFLPKPYTPSQLTDLVDRALSA